MPLFSIITTCYNAADCIQATIESVLQQDFRDFEYIIMDGLSTDDTLQIASSFMDAFSDVGISFHIFSEKDNGIYQGMNHGILHAHGNYINFMNAGDCLYEKDTLSKIADHLRNTDTSQIPDVIYGDAVSIEFGQRYKYIKDISVIERRMPFSHQSVFASRELLLKYPLKENMKICSDYDFLLTAYKSNAKFADSDVTVCTVTLDGLSSYDLLHAFEETTAVQRAHGIDHFPGKAYNKKIKSYRIKQFVMDHFPKFIIKSIRKIQRIQRGQNEHC